MIDRPVFIVNVVSGYQSYKRQDVYENEILCAQVTSSNKKKKQQMLL